MKKFFNRKNMNVLIILGIILLVSYQGFSNIEANTGVEAWDKILTFALTVVDFLVTFISIAGVIAILVMIGLEVFAPDMGRSMKSFITICIITAIALSSKAIIVLLGGATIDPTLVSQIEIIKMIRGV